MSIVYSFDIGRGNRDAWKDLKFGYLGDLYSDVEESIASRAHEVTTAGNDEHAMTSDEVFLFHCRGQIDEEGVLSVLPNRRAREACRIGRALKEGARHDAGKQ